MISNRKHVAAWLFTPLVGACGAGLHADLRGPVHRTGPEQAATQYMSDKSRGAPSAEQPGRRDAQAIPRWRASRPANTGVYAAAEADWKIGS